MSNSTVIPFVGDDDRYHYIYLITNKVNGKYYKGVHSTFDLNDNYLGSGTALEKAKEKYGKENFDIEIIKFFKNREEALNGEFEYITKSDLNSDNCYNISYGGYSIALGKVSAKDNEGNFYWVDKNDMRLINGELVGVAKNMINVQDDDGNVYRVQKDDYRIKNGMFHTMYKNCFVVKDNETSECYFVSHEEYDPLRHTSIHKNKVVVEDKDGNKFAVDCDDERFLSGELISIHKHKHPVKDKDGNIYYVDNKDERYLNGELVSINKGRVVVKDKDGNRLSVSKNDPRYLSGELVMHSVGTTNARDKYGNLIRVSVTDERLKDGTLCGQFKGTIVLKNKITGVSKRFSLDAPECNSDEWINPTLGSIHIKHKITNKIYNVSENDPRLASDEYLICNELYSICKDNITKKVLLQEFRQYYNDGWIYPYKTCILYKSDNDRYITDICHKNNKDILPFIENDWKLVDVKNEIIIMKDSKFKYIHRNLLKYYQKDGWTKIYLHYLKVEYIQKVIDGQITIEEATEKSMEKINARKSKNAHKPID